MSSINTNIDAMRASVAYSAASAQYAKSSQRISTTLRINSAKDDPAGLGVANRLKAQVLSYSKATDNINLGIGAVQIADAALTRIATVLTQMQTLALSSASGTSDATTRASNQTLFSTYRTQIDSIANSAYFNGSSLLNGDTSTMAVQTGIQAGDTLTLNFSSALSSALGSGDTAALTSQGSTTTAMASGDLLINGYTVGASLSSYDNYSYASKAGSAIAKAAAINLVSSTTNVVADVGSTTASGSTMTAAGTNTAGTVTINGTAIAFSLSSTADYATNRASVVNAINNYSVQTGVTATNTNSTAKGVTLTASDGRNITVAFDGVNLSAANTGIAAAGTYTGTFTLRSLDQTAITISSAVSGTLANAGLSRGSYASNTSQVSTVASAGSTTAASSLAAGDLLINGYAIGAPFSSDDTATDATTTSSTKIASAIATAAAINRQTSLTGVTATANSNVVVGTGFSAGLVDSIYLNGQTIAVSLSGTSTAANVVTALNSYTGSTGVTASDNGSGITLTASDGRNISIGVGYNGSAVDGTRIGLGGNAALTGADATAATAMTYTSTVKLAADTAFTVSSGTNGYSNFNALGFREGTFGGATTDTKVSSLDISTQTGGTNAIAALADAVDQISAYQALVGAQENALGYQSDYVSNTSTAVSTAYGNVVNYDLAEETTLLASAQIKQNGAMAMLAQANMSSDMVSYLLKQYIT
jgi:flagellin